MGQIAGQIFFEQEALSEVDPRRQAAEIGFVGQNPDNQLVTDKVWHELAFGLENQGMTRGEILHRLDDTTDRLHLKRLRVKAMKSRQYRNY